MWFIAKEQVETDSQALCKEEKVQREEKIIQEVMERGKRVELRIGG